MGKNLKISSWNPKLRLSMLQNGKGKTRFVVKATHFGKEKLLSMDVELKAAEYYFSPEAAKAREDLKKQAPIIFLIFGGVTLLLFLIVFLLSQ